MLKPIDTNDLGPALDVLKRGFPTRSAAFWRSGFDRVMSAGPRAAEWPLGYFFLRDGEVHGIILTIATWRSRGEARQLVVNLSSWYVDTDARWAAPSMLMEVFSARPSTAITDLSPAPAVAKISLLLGFKRWTDGFLLMSLPHTLLGGEKHARVVPLRKLPADALNDADRQLLEDHERLGCIAAALDGGTAWRPLVFARRKLRGLPCAHLIYADSRREALAHRRSLALFLLRQGIPFLRIEANAAERPRGGVFRPGNKLFRGDMSLERIDYAYSELVYFDVA